MSGMVPEIAKSIAASVKDDADFENVRAKRWVFDESILSCS